MKQRQCPRCPTGPTYKELCPLCYHPTVDLTIYTDTKFINPNGEKKMTAEERRDELHLRQMEQDIEVTKQRANLLKAQARKENAEAYLIELDFNSIAGLPTN